MISIDLTIGDGVDFVLGFLVSRDLTLFDVIEVFLAFKLFGRAAEDVGEFGVQLVRCLNTLSWHTGGSRELCCEVGFGKVEKVVGPIWRGIDAGGLLDVFTRSK